MSELILHHYAASPFAQKARLLLGFKGLAWHSVHIPPMMPKPDLTALSGGYRKTPVLQAGADIYCDTALIARRLEQEKSAPALFPLGQELVVSAFAAWADSVVFQHAVSLVFQPESAAVRFAKMPPEMLKAFVADRAGLFRRTHAEADRDRYVRSRFQCLDRIFDRSLSGLLRTGDPGNRDVIDKARGAFEHGGQPRGVGRRSGEADQRNAHAA